MRQRLEVHLEDLKKICIFPPYMDCDFSFEFYNINPDLFFVITSCVLVAFFRYSKTSLVFKLIISVVTF